MSKLPRNRFGDLVCVLLRLIASAPEQYPIGFVRQESATQGGHGMTISTTTGLSDAQHRVQLRRAVVASTVGTIIEAYDFLLYVQVAPLVIWL
jgi:hypothetical protein